MRMVALDESYDADLVSRMLDRINRYKRERGEDTELVLERPQPRIVASRDDAGVVYLRKQSDGGGDE